MKLRNLFSRSGGDVGTWDALRCPKCSAIYHVGRDSSISTWELVSGLMGLPVFGYGDTQSGRHDSIKAMQNWEDPEGRNRSADVLNKVRAAVEGGARRRWTCEKCKYSGNKYPKH